MLKNAFRVSFLQDREAGDLLAELCRAVALEKLNLSLLTFCGAGSFSRVNLVVDGGDREKILDLSRPFLTGSRAETSECAVLSIFPHRNNPAVAGAFLEGFAGEDLPIAGLAHSNAALSAIVDEGRVRKTANALFERFLFSPYRTPMDWKLAQKGKEKLYREVVATYQERRPKVYGLEWRDENDLFNVSDRRQGLVESVGRAFHDLASRKIELPFVLSGPCGEDARIHLSFCLPRSGPSAETALRIGREFKVETVPSAALFSMNGPHFSERYGIVNDLLLSFRRAGVTLLALSCAVSSISGVVPSDQIREVVRLIQGCFEVPAVVKRGG